MILGDGFSAFALSLAMLAAFVLGVFGVRLIATGRDRKRGALMLGVALVLVMNVLIWAWPIQSHAEATLPIPGKQR